MALKPRGLVIADKLREYFPKVIHEFQGLFSSIVLYDKGEPRIILCVANTTTPYVYGKIVGIDRVSSLDCNMLVYMSEGLFIFARDTDEFIREMFDKLKRFKKV